MHILQSYSLAAGQRIHKIHTNEKIFPLPFDNYILIQPWSKASKNYSLWSEVLSLIFPLIEKSGLKILQVGGPNEQPLPGCHNVSGQTNWGQLEYLVSKAKLVLSADSVSAHLAGHYNIPLVQLISNNYSECVSAYFGDKTKQIFLEPDRTKLKPSFSFDEPPVKQIDTIPVEKVARAVCKLLNLNLDYPYTQLFLGQHHINHIWEMVANNLVNLQSLNISNIVVRMDFFHNEEVLEKQLQIGNVAIVCNQPIDIDLLKKYKSRITELVYEINENHVPNFVEEAQKVGLNKFVLISKLSEEQLNPIKLYYLDASSPILPVPSFKKADIQEIKGENDLYYRSRKFTISNNKVYPSKAAWLEDKPMNLAERNLFPAIENDEFWGESQHFAILKKI